MKPQRIGILYPGAMGISIAASAQNSGHQVYWASEGRGSATRERATKLGLHDTGTLAALSAECFILVSVCPPHAAEDVANQVLACGFNGLFVDANAISPERTIRIGQTLAGAGVSFVDGGIIGEPAWKPNTTCLYLAGLRAADIAACFSAGPLGTRVLGATVGKASALKMCFAAYTKGTIALLSAILATAESLGVRDALLEQWGHDDPNFAENVYKRVCAVTAKAWRFSGEMEEIASTFRDAGLPGEFHAAAAVVYQRLAQFKDSETPPPIEDVLGALLQTEKTNAG
jgi:3-hydroxyisobutyrate dehydrogenase-like beta-hydroxyacid dehydrogenase